MWEKWFAWRPVRLLTLEWAWLRWVIRRPAESGDWSYGAYDYANPPPIDKSSELVSDGANP
jgi:hypothetical protein